MSIQLALDKETNDLIKIEGVGLARVGGGRYTVQLVKNKLSTLLGEWKLDPTKGWLAKADFERNPDLFDLEMRAKTVILSVKGVQQVDTMTIKLSARVLYLSFTATTIYGGISLTIPWGN